MQRGGESTAGVHAPWSQTLSACAIFMDGISEGQKSHKRDVQG